MPFPDILDFMRHRKTEALQVVPLADPEAEAAPPGYDPDAGEYFEIRLNEMYLKDARLWHREVAPATFVVTEFSYAGGAARRPFFVSNTLPPDIPAALNPAPLRVKFSNTLVAGPTPYIGGDVAVFVGLFQTTLKDWRAIAFDVFEKLFGAIDVGAVSQYLKLADKLSGEVLRCLGDRDVECILADQRPLGEHAPPRPGYLAYLGAGGAKVPADSLAVRDGTLKRMVDGEPRQYDDTDYCLVRVRRMTTRNDHASMPFHAVWSNARAQAMSRKPEEAQMLMLDCARQIYASPDLTEGDKERLITYYQAKLHAPTEFAQSLGGGGGGATRAGAAEVISAMRQSAAASKDFYAREIDAVFEDMARLASELEQQPDAGPDSEQLRLQQYMERSAASPARKPRPDRLMRALALGSIDASAVAPRREGD